MFKVKAINLYEALERVAVGGGECYVIAVDPTPMKIGENQTVQVASISTSDGEKTGITSIQIHCIDMDKPEIYYATANIKAAVSSLSKITDMLIVESKGSHLLVSDEKKESVVRVALVEKDTVLELPNSADGAIMVMMEREKFVNAIRLGGYSAEDSNIAGIDVIGFLANEEEKKLTVVSRRSTTMCQAVAPVTNIGNKSAEEDVWHLINHKFIQNLVPKLSGDVVQIAFTPKFMVVRCQNAIFGSKKSEGTMAENLIKKLSDKSFDYSGTIQKKDLLLSMEISIVGVDEKIINLETNENGTLKVCSVTGSNKSNVSQKTHEGKMEAMSFYVEVLKSGLNGCGDELHYFGKTTPKYIMFDGEDAGVEYVSIVAPVNLNKK